MAAAGISTTIDAVLSKTTMYLKSPLFGALLPAGKTWMKLDLQQAGASQGLDLNTILSQDPTQSLGALQSLKGATEVGTETIDGVVDDALPGAHRPVEAAGRRRAEPRQRRARTTRGSAATGTCTGCAATSPHGSGTTKSVITLTVDLSDFGKKVNVAVPPAAADGRHEGSIPGLGG